MFSHAKREAIRGYDFCQHAKYPWCYRIEKRHWHSCERMTGVLIDKRHGRFALDHFETVRSSKDRLGIIVGNQEAERRRSFVRMSTLHTTGFRIVTVLRE